MYWLSLLVSLWHFTPHPIHVSVSEVEVRQAEVEWTARIYTDDLLLGVYGKEVDMGVLEDVENIKQDILRYMQKHIQVTIGGTSLQWSLSGVHPDPEALWITLTTDISGMDYHSLMVNNTVLMEVYKDQKNIVNFEAPAAKTKTVIFEPGDAGKKITF